MAFETSSYLRKSSRYDIDAGTQVTLYWDSECGALPFIELGFIGKERIGRVSLDIESEKYWAEAFSARGLVEE